MKQNKQKLLKVLIIAADNDEAAPALFRLLEKSPFHEPFFITALPGKMRSSVPFEAGQAPNRAIFRAGGPEAIDSGFGNDFKSFLLEHNPHVVHFFGVEPIGAAALWAAKNTMPESAVICTMPDSTHEMPMLQREFLQAHLEKADLIIPPSPAKNFLAIYDKLTNRI